MRSLRKLRVVGTKLEDIPAVLEESLPEVVHGSETVTVLKTIGWITAGAGALAIGLFLGRELRFRYKFNRRTPYDFYSHSGDTMQDVEFGVGI